MSILHLALALWLGGGLLAFSAWAIHQYATQELQSGADWTTKLIYRSGQALILFAALAIAGGILGTAARAAWTMVVG